MYIEPNTIIRILKDCPLDPSYEHTIFFPSRSTQTAYFKDLTKHTLTHQSYQRVKRGYMRVAMQAENLYDCNYLMFQNTSFGDKWFYAFIKSVEYVNNVTSEIQYEIDVMQTWFYDCTVNDCFVEREHSITDNVGDNLVRESVYFGEYVYENPKEFKLDGLSLEDLSVVIMYNPAIYDPINLVSEIENYRYTENLYSGVFQGVRFIAVPAIRENVEIIEPLISSTDFLSGGGFLSAFLMPTMFLPLKDDTASNDGVEYNRSVMLEIKRPRTIGAHLPKNNKLLTYPYTCAYLTSHRGKGNDFAFEYSTVPDTLYFQCEGNLSANPSVMAYPYAYKGKAHDLEGAVSIDSYPICTWGADGVTEWINNNLFKSLATIGTIAAIGVSPATATAVSGAGASTSLAPVAYTPNFPLSMSAPPTTQGVGSTISQVGSDIGDVFHATLNTPAGALTAIGMARSEFDPGHVHGGVNGDILIGNAFGRHIHVYPKRITEHYAGIIDEYFTRFGYATNRVKVPNISKRPYFNYIKTGGCNIVGSIPCDEMRKICSIFDRGITFWKHTATIGDYSVNNSPIEEVV